MGNRYQSVVDISAKHDKVSGSCIEVTVHRPKCQVKFLVDCGLYQGEKDCEISNYANFDFQSTDIEFVLLTHVHADHSGRLPLLYRRGFTKRIFCTTDTDLLLGPALLDDEKVIGINAEKHNIRPLYTSEHVELTLNNVRTCDFGETIQPVEEINVTFFKNAHLVGAAMILVQIGDCDSERFNILFVGDYKKSNIYFAVSSLPEYVRNLPLYIVCESTYGGIESCEMDEPKFDCNISNLIKADKKAIIIPALSLGRYQEISYRIKQGKEMQLFDPNIPVYFDGNLAHQYCDLYKYKLDIYSHMKSFMPLNSKLVGKENREEVLNSDEQRIIVTTSGMGNFGPAAEYISKFIEREDAAIHFTSFLSPDSLGRKLVDTSNDSFVIVGGVVKRKVAEVFTTSEFSSHAKQDELLEFLSQFSNIRAVLVNHGETESKKAFAEACKEKLGNCREVAILGDGYTIRMNPYSIVKSIAER